jgi:hypothetical protein
MFKSRKYGKWSEEDSEQSSTIKPKTFNSRSSFPFQRKIWSIDWPALLPSEKPTLL